MSAKIFREGRSDLYSFHASINVLSRPIDDLHLDDNPVFLAQMPSQPALFGIEPGTKGSQKIKRSEQVITIPIRSADGQILAALELSEGIAFGGTIIKNVTRAWATASGIAVLVAAAAGWIVARRLTAPLSELITATEQMSTGKLSYRVEINTRDEFDLLGKSFNSMAAGLEKIIETLRNFVADSAHELLTPVSALRLNLELAEEGKDFQEFLSEAQIQAFRLQSLVDNLLDLSKIEAVPTRHRSLSLIELVSDIETNFKTQADKKGITLQVESQVKEASVHGDPEQITPALENLVDNAIKFSDPGGQVNIVIDETADSFQIAVDDHGIGIPENEQPLVFERFFRGRNTTEFSGSGLGLAIVQAIADQHGASVNLYSAPSGTTVTLQFPKTRSPENS